jgi:hypothetical protein
MILTIEGRYGNWFDEVRVNGSILDPARSQKLVNHSPDGFAWGYAGSGPAQLALAILLAAGLDDDTAVALHQAFKAEHVATLPDGDDFVLAVDVQGWLSRQLRLVCQFCRQGYGYRASCGGPAGDSHGICSSCDGLTEIEQMTIYRNARAAGLS